MLPLEEFDGEDDGVLQPRPLYVSGLFPTVAVLCFFTEATEALSEVGGLTRIGDFGVELGGRPIYATLDGDVAVFHPGVGGPQAAHCLERAIASGVTRVLAVGGAGALAETFGEGEVLVVSSAIRDEGTSFHYLAPGRAINFDSEEVHRLVTGLAALGISATAGSTWTTDADFRETRDRIERRRAEGCAAVEMEAASLGAVCHFRGVRYGHVLYSGDAVHGAQWAERSWTTSGRRAQLLEAAIALSRR